MISIEQIAAIDYITQQSHGSAPLNQADITVNFHPDRKTSSGVALLDALRLDNELKSQFETGTSNGGLSAHAGGNRWLWEQHAFGGAYDDSDAHQRPKYGALNYKAFSVGASPRFGSACLRFKAHILERSTFCFPDSHLSPVDFSIYPHTGRLIKLAEAANLDSLDNYIEAHIHGPVNLNRDIDCLVLDPSYRGSPIEEQARALPVNIQWHAGFQIDVSTIEQNPEYRGASCVKLANRLAVGGILTPKILGDALHDSSMDANEIKKLWHYVAKFGLIENPK